VERTTSAVNGFLPVDGRVPFCNLKDYGETDAGGRTFDSAARLLAWLRSEAQMVRFSCRSGYSGMA
jgi:hypothetical protein